MDRPITESSGSENLVNMSTLEPLRLPEGESPEVPEEEIAEIVEEESFETTDTTPEPDVINVSSEDGSKNLNVTDNPRRSERILSTSLAKT